ncbi:hypothetical protein RUM44_001066 [Polyplax serrata]|uniref:FERM domain-containing protein 8 n=1 Tax=Polyplax serrata TaxID=468196 RepID=A0ABR1B6L7_POLSC
MNVDVKSIGFEKETEGNCHMKNEVNVLADSSTNCIASMDNNTNYVNVGEARYGGDFSYLGDRDKSEFNSQEHLYTVSQRFDNTAALSCDGQAKVLSDSEEPNLRLQKVENSSSPEALDADNYRSLKVCIYLMSKVALHMELEDGINCTAQDITQAILHEEELGLPRSASNVFTLWMCSGLVELQLKSFHKPFEIRQRWRELIERFSSATDSCKRRDEPALSYQRNIYFSKKEEELIKDHKILDLLYEEARYNILEGRYPCEPIHYISLGAIQARIELGPYSPQIHTIQFFRDNQARFLPHHIRRTAWSWLRISGKNSPEVRLLEQYKRIPSSTPVRKLIQKYLEFCWTLPYYGGAFFQGQIEQPVRGLTSLITHQDMPVLIIINNQGVYVIDHIQCTLLLGLKYKDMSWDYAKPSQEDNPDCLPCLFIQFVVLENGARVSKILQVFSKQAVMMDALISSFVEESKRKNSSNEVDGGRSTCETSTDGDDAQMPLNTRRDMGPSCLCNKLSRLTLATFDDDGDH